jgi:hypothetical protein
MPGVQVELRTASDATVLASTSSDGSGIVHFPDVPPGRYVVRATREGFLPIDSTAFSVRANEVAQVLVDIQLTFVMPTVDVRSSVPSPTNSVQPVSMSDMLSGAVLDVAPLVGDDFQNPLMLPGVVRGPTAACASGRAADAGRCRSAASLIDPSTGDADLELPDKASNRSECSPIRCRRCGRFTSISPASAPACTSQWEFKPGNLFHACAAP